MCDVLQVSHFCALGCRNMTEERNYPQGLRMWDKVEVGGFSAGCTVHVFTSWRKSQLLAGLEKYCLTVFSEFSLFWLLGILQGGKQNSLYILWSLTCNTVLGNTPRAWIPLPTCRETVTSISGQVCNSNLLLK